MIARSIDGRLHLITQPDHARLARQIMERAAPLAGHPRKDSILLAIGEHDNGWREEDAAPAIDPASGRVFDFVSAPLAVRHGVWPRGVARLAADPWAAALVAQHALTIYDRFRSDAAWTAFFATMTTARGTLLGVSAQPGAGDLDTLVDDYQFLRLGDLISLAFCTGSTETQWFGPWTVHPSSDRVEVKPDPFGGAAVPVEIEARTIPDRAYRSDQDLRDAIASSSTTTLSGTILGTA